MVEAGLFRLLDGLDDFVEIRPLAGIEFGMEQFAIGANFEGAAARRHKRERRDPSASDLIRSPSSRILVAKLTAFGV